MDISNPRDTRTPSAAGVSARDLRNALLARSTLASAGAWAAPGGTEAARDFNRHAAKAAEYANAVMEEERKERVRGSGDVAA